jgi:hypothetical protein
MKTRSKNREKTPEGFVLRSLACSVRRAGSLARPFDKDRIGGSEARYAEISPTLGYNRLFPTTTRKTA